MSAHQPYMQRAFDLARLGAGAVSPNPMVGAVLVYQHRIIGEGWHRQYGQAHAEVNAVASVLPTDRPLIPDSTLYVSLEPCTIHGNTPPCTDLIIREKIPRVVIATIDRTEGVNGQSKVVLEKAGVEVITDILPQRGAQLAAIRNTFVHQKRPYIVLKWAQSADGFMGKKDRQVWLTNAISKRLVHKWRSELDAILVGTHTALLDNPQLNNRLYFGKSPLRIVLDRHGRVPLTHHLLQDKTPTWVISQNTNLSETETRKIILLPFDKNLLPTLLQKLVEAKKTSLLVEGGSTTLQYFLDAGLWDECRIFKTRQQLGKGIAAPTFEGYQTQQYHLLDDVLETYNIR